MGETTIEWTSRTWNPVRGCSLVSSGCQNCYAMGQAHRFSGKGKPFEGLTKARVSLGPVWTGKVRLVPEMLALPLSWRTPQRVFVNSMSDLFHEGLKDHEIAQVFSVMETARTRGHVFQVLTKRAKRMREWVTEWARKIDYADDSGRGYAGRYDHVWLGVSAEDQERANERVPELLATPAAVRFVSYEPALGPVDFKPWLYGSPKLDWIIVGGES
jgi:protein gp37